MTPISIGRFRRITFALVSLLFAGLAFSSIASAGDFRIEDRKFRMDITGQYINEWHGQTSGYGTGGPWSWEHGKVTSGFRTPGGIKFKGSKFHGDLPGKTPLPKFQFFALQPVVAKSNNRAEYKRKINHVPFCGGELGQCDGTEKSGIEASSDSCKRPRSKLPFDLEFDQEGHRSLIRMKFGQHGSMTDFCGKKYKGEDSFQAWPKPLGLPNGLNAIASLEKGASTGWSSTFERGWIGGDNHPEGARNLKTCPGLSGLGSRQCWILDIKVDVKRTK